MMATCTSLTAARPSCPMCNAKPPREPEGELKNFNFIDYPVTLPDGREISFEEATTTYIDTFFEDFAVRSYKVPAVFSYHHDSVLDSVPDDDVVSTTRDGRATPEERNENGNREPRKGPVTAKKILEDRRQKDAVERVARASYSWGFEQLGPMFVISEFKFSNFLKNVQMNTEEKHDISAADGEHDIVIITKDNGVMFIQVKSVEGKNYRSKIRKAYEQILKDKLAFKTMNRDLPFLSNVQVNGFVAIPNLAIEQLEKVNFCKDHQQVILTASDLSEEQFRTWLSLLVSRFSKPDDTNSDKLSHDDENISQYKLLTGRYVGLASVVKLRTLSDAIHKVAQKISRIILNPEQNQCLKRKERKMILLGDFGTGKSILLMQKAESVLKDVAVNDGRVYVISFSVVSDGSGKVHDVSDNLVPYLQEINPSDDTSMNQIVFTSFRDHLKSINSYCNEFPFKLTPDILCEILKVTQAQQGNSHFFLDEVPLCLGLRHDAWQNFGRFCNDHESMFIWISIATCSFTLTEGKDFSDLECYLPGTPFQTTVLKRCMRMTRNGFKLLQAVREFKGDGLRLLTNCGNVIDGPRPLWMQISPCLCGEGRDPFHCDCLADIRLKAALEEALKRVGQVNWDDITILLHGLHDTSTKMTKFLGEVVQKACRAADIHYKWKITSVSCDKTHKERECDVPNPAVTLVDLRSYKGNECRVVLFVDPFNGPVMWRVKSLWHGWVDISIASCRSLAQTVFITWPDEEQRHFVEDLKECMLEAGASAKNESTLNFYEELVNDISEGHKYHADKSGGFMKFLLAKGVIDKF